MRVMHDVYCATNRSPFYSIRYSKYNKNTKENPQKSKLTKTNIRRSHV